MITKNSKDPCLKDSLDSVLLESKRAEVQVRLIIVDGGSTDGTLDMVKKYDELNPVIIMDKNGTRATARQKGILEVKTQFFAFIDSDVVLLPYWFTNILKYFKDPNVGAVWGLAINLNPHRKKRMEFMSRIYKTTAIEMQKRYGLRRGLLHDTMIRTISVRGICIPKYLHAMEDHYVRKYIEHVGWKWEVTNTPYSLHYMPADSNGTYTDAYCGWKIGFYTKKWYLKHLFLLLGKILYLFIATRDFQFIKNELIFEIKFFKGSIRTLLPGR